MNVQLTVHTTVNRSRVPGAPDGWWVIRAPPYPANLTVAAWKAGEAKGG
jgi:hypothetical protein